MHHWRQFIYMSTLGIDTYTMEAQGMGHGGRAPPAYFLIELHLESILLPSLETFAFLGNLCLPQVGAERSTLCFFIIDLITFAAVTIFKSKSQTFFNPKSPNYSITLKQNILPYTILHYYCEESNF